MHTKSVTARLQSMDEYDFEWFVADLWERQGWSCDVSQESGDAGIDVTATKTTPYKQKKLIQAKRYGPNTTVGGPDIQQYASLKHQQPDADSVVVVTTNTFTSAAYERADELNVKLVDGDDLEQMVESLNAHDLLNEYAPQTTAEDATTSTRQTATPSEAADGGVALQQGDGALSPERSPEWLHTLERARHWHRLVPIGVALMFVAIFVAGTLDGTNNGILNGLADMVGYGVLFPLLAAIPIAWYLDMRYVRQVTDWYPDTVAYLVGGLLVPYIAFPLYYYRRYKTIGL